MTSCIRASPAACLLPPTSLAVPLAFDFGVNRFNIRHMPEHADTRFEKAVIALMLAITWGGGIKAIIIIFG